MAPGGARSWPASPAPAKPCLRWWGTVLYPALLVGMFLGGQLLLGMAGVPVDQQAAIAALPALLSLLLSLPLRLRRA